jgi:hypothetical protein
MRVTFWTGERSRGLRIGRPCSCGCESPAAGYLTASDPDGNGITVWADDELELHGMVQIAMERGLLGKPLPGARALTAMPLLLEG